MILTEYFPLKCEIVNCATISQNVIVFFRFSDLSSMGCMSPLYATPPISPGSDTGPNFEDQFETPSAIFSTHDAGNNDHFARDTHMRIILGNNKEASQPSKYERANVCKENPSH